jgi:hypothetical protein
MTKLFSIVTVLSLFGAIAFMPVVGGIQFHQGDGRRN